MGRDGMGRDRTGRDGRRWGGTGWDRMGWEEMGWDGMGWDGMGGDGKGWDGMDEAGLGNGVGMWRGWMRLDWMRLSALLSTAPLLQLLHTLTRLSRIGMATTPLPTAPTFKLHPRPLIQPRRLYNLLLASCEIGHRNSAGTSSGSTTLGVRSKGCTCRRRSQVWQRDPGVRYRGSLVLDP